MSVCSPLVGRGNPVKVLGGGGTPSQVWVGGTLSHIWVGGRGGYPVPGLGEGVPHPRYGGTLQGLGVPWHGVPLLSRSQVRLGGVPGYSPHHQDWVPPHQQDGVPPAIQVRTGEVHQLEQHGVYLLRGGRYASCVHAGGLTI